MSELQLPWYDLGTPKPRTATTQVSISVDGQQVSVDEGTSVLRAAAIAGINIPKLCATDSLDAFGSCRMCLVEIEGRKGAPASCTTLGRRRHGCDIHNRVSSKSYARIYLELYISDHPLDCVTCPTQRRL